jgi:N-methylhydantoinase A
MKPLTTELTQTRLAADIGGTFTDIVLETSKGLFTAKVPTNTSQPELGVLSGVDVVLKDASINPNDIDIFIHGTTLATNALIERKGVKTALITTEGFRDSLEIAYESRYDQFDLMIDKPEQLIPRNLRYTVKERMNVHGEVLIELDEGAVAALSDRLNEDDIGAVAVGFLHSYANPKHEQRVRDILVAKGCTAEITLSSDVCPEVREYERLMTTACNAYVQPIMARYLRALETAFIDKGFRCPIFLMTSGGGMTTLESAIKYPIRLVESGPSGGAVLAAKIAEYLNESSVLSFDMGGTTAKISLIESYKPKTARNFEIARSARFQKGSGMPVRIPVIEMIEIGAGGGSIAHVDKVGRLNIGPESAGAVPGAACYGKGGMHPTVTDANLHLGRIEPNAFAEGKMKLDMKAAKVAINNDISLSLDVADYDAAFGITEMVEENMANAARIHSVEHGVDLSKFSMIAFGGGGPLHAVRLAEKLGMNRVIIPANSSVGSALGFLSAPISYEMVHSLYTTLTDFDLDKVNSMMSSISSEAHVIVREGAKDANVVETRTAYMRYVGQGHEIQVPIPTRELTKADIEDIKSTYDTCYRQLYGRTIPERDIEVLSWSVVVSTVVDAVHNTSNMPETSTAKPSGDRSAFVPALNDYAAVSTYWRPDLNSGDALTGPALVEEPQTTTFVTANFKGRLDIQMNLILDRIEP